jgi:hypothetical protein
MADNTRIVGEVDVVNESKYRVAWDMTKALAGSNQDRRDELLELFARCLITMKDPHLGLDAVKRLARGESL